MECEIVNLLYFDCSFANAILLNILGIFHFNMIDNDSNFDFY